MNAIKHYINDIPIPTAPCEALGGALVAEMKFRQSLAAGGIGNSALLGYAENIRGYDELSALGAASKVIDECFSNLNASSDKEDDRLPLDSDEDWLLLGKHVAQDMRETYREYAAQPENRHKLEAIFQIVDPGYIKATRNARYGRTKQKAYQKRFEDMVETIFSLGVEEGVHTAIAYYEVLTQLIAEKDFSPSLIKAARRLIVLHSGIDKADNDQLVSKLRRTSGEGYENLLFDPELFELTIHTGRVELSVRRSKIEIKHNFNSAPTGCPAFARTVVKLCRLIESKIQIPEKTNNRTDAQNLQTAGSLLISLMTEGVLDEAVRNDPVLSKLL